MKRETKAWIMISIAVICMLSLGIFLGHKTVEQREEYREKVRTNQITGEVIDNKNTVWEVRKFTHEGRNITCFVQYRTAGCLYE